MTLSTLARRAGRLACAAVAACLIPVAAHAAYPDQPITVIVGFGAGGAADTLARLVAKEAEKTLGQPIVIQNEPGGGGVVASTKLMNAKPDGYTVGMAVSSTLTYPPLASSTVKYTPENFDMLASVASLQNAIVAKGDAPYATFADVVAAGKSGKKFSFASTSPVVNLTMEFVSKQAGIEMKIVPVKGGAEAMKEVLGGNIDLAWSAGIHQKYLQDKSLKVLAGANMKRLGTSPEVPTFREMGYEVGSDSHFLFFAPKGLPADVSKRLVDALSAAARSPTVSNLAQEKMDLPSDVLTPQALRAEIEAQTDEYKRLIAAAAAQTAAK